MKTTSETPRRKTLIARCFRPIFDESKLTRYPNSSPPYSHQYYYLLLAPDSGLKESLLHNKSSWLLDSDSKANIYQTEFSQKNLITKHHERIVASDFISALYQTTAPCAPPQTNHFLFHTGHQRRQSDHHYTMVNCVLVSFPPPQTQNSYNILLTQILTQNKTKGGMGRVRTYLKNSETQALLWGLHPVGKRKKG